MERLLLNRGNIDVDVNPCSFFRTGIPIAGEQTSAEWIRIVFHDAITANTEARAGGLDASIGFETLRPENVGLHFVSDIIGIVIPHQNVNKLAPGFIRSPIRIPLAQFYVIEI
ncbi:hypothetical protein G7Y89_g12164 [Cudoniella acicularis]|uniref:Peroxidase n=1 Tax=Cudoniella acicularis TaxID=354080 RepID=A0A8H4R9K1_9HELO|nr:hypothetical protein G7Y89_g12164 [Cudoniella acicularis]